MTRLADRMLQGCQPFRLSLWAPEEYAQGLRKQISESSGKDLSQEQIERLLRTKSFIEKGEPVGKEMFDAKSFDGVPIISADDVALYTYSLPEGTNLKDAVASMAPPFKKFFIEVQRVPNPYNLHAWG